MSDPIASLLDRIAIQDVLTLYARACDTRDWKAFEHIFCPDVSVDYGGEFKLEGREPVVDMIKSMLGGCGPTQHLLGNFEIAVKGDEACSACYVRAIHAGLGPAKATLYEVWAEYRDALERTTEGWRVKERRMVVHKEVGARDILKPL